jgi:outer membrane lipoprotein-sorting protein
MRLRTGRLLGVALALCSSMGARADEKADALIQASREATTRIETLQADLDLKLGDRAITGKVVAKRPNLLRLEMKGYPMELVVSDGKTHYTYMPAQNEYQKRELSGGTVGGVVPGWVYPVSAFLNPVGIGQALAGATRTYKGRETVAGREYDVIEVVYPVPSERTLRWYISPEDKLVHRVVNTPKDPKASPIIAEMTNIRTGAPVAADAFVWTPPATAKLYAPPTLADYEKMLVPVGMPAPSFDLSTPGGGRLSLENALKGKKAVLVNFWFYG